MARLIRICPVCNSRKLAQDWITEDREDSVMVRHRSRKQRNGSHCRDCGVKLYPNCEEEDNDRE